MTFQNSNTDIDEYLSECRKQIDQIDHEIMGLLSKRSKCVLEIAELKAQANKEIYVPSREQQLIQQLCEHNTSHFSDNAVNNIFKAITKECRLLQQKNIPANTGKIVRLSIQGIPGSFSEQVAKEYCEQHAMSNIELIYAMASSSVVEHVLQDQAELGVVAIFNNWGGIVTETVNALSTFQYEIVDTYKLMVRQNILALPGTKLSDITDVYSHQQALSQCRKYLTQHLPQAEPHEVADTAKAAMNLSERVYHDNAAVIGSINCAKYYNLNPLAYDVQDKDCNETMFLIIKKQA